MAFLRCSGQRGPFVLRVLRAVNISSIAQQFHYRFVVSYGRPQQRGSIIGVFQVNVDISSMQKKLHNCLMVFLCCLGQRLDCVLEVLKVDGDISTIETQLHDRLKVFSAAHDRRI